VLSAVFPDHDQRDTLSGGVDVEVETGTWVSAPIGYGSGSSRETARITSH